MNNLKRGTTAMYEYEYVQLWLPSGTATSTVRVQHAAVQGSTVPLAAAAAGLRRLLGEFFFWSDGNVLLVMRRS
jgi:hypothetical protein